MDGASEEDAEAGLGPEDVAVGPGSEHGARSEDGAGREDAAVGPGTRR